MTREHDEQANSGVNEAKDDIWEEWEQDAQPAQPGDNSVGKLKLNTKQLEILEKLAEIGCTIKEITYILGVCKDPDTLSRGYGDVIERARSRGNWKLRYAQYQKALEGNERLLIWLGKQRLGQRDYGMMDTELGNEPLPWTDD